MKLSDKLAHLGEGDNRQWRVEREPHDYKDGTTHFTHVVYDTTDGTGAPMKIHVGEYVTPDMAEMMCELHNNWRQIVAALRQFGN